MSEKEKLKHRLDEMFENGLKNMHISKGPEWNNISEEERAKHINEALDRMAEWDALTPEQQMRIQIKEVYDDLKEAIKLCQTPREEFMNLEWTEERKKLHELFGILDMALCTLGNWVRNGR